MKEITHAPDFSGLDPDTGEPWMPSKVARLMGLRRATEEETRAACERAVAENPRMAEAVRAGKPSVVNVLVRLVMTGTRSGADPAAARRILSEILGTTCGGAPGP